MVSIMSEGEFHECCDAELLQSLELYVDFCELYLHVLLLPDERVSLHTRVRKPFGIRQIVSLMQNFDFISA